MGFYGPLSGVCLHLFLCTRFWNCLQFQKLVKLELLLCLIDYSCPGVQRGKVHIYLKDLTTLSWIESIM